MTMEVSDYTIVDFLRDMAPFNLLHRAPRARNNFWVFWRQGGGEGQGGDLGLVNETLTNNNGKNVQEYLQSLLCKAEDSTWANVALIQFWVPTTNTSGKNGGVLETSNQPFAIYRIERGICEYRKYCTGLEISIFQHGENNVVEFGGLIERIFRHQEEEEYLNYQEGDFAYKCGIRTSFFLPVFKPSGRCCYGVLEISVTFKGYIFGWDSYRLATDIFEEANFRYTSLLQWLESTEIEEIIKALRVVRTTHQLPLAQIWIPCCSSNAMAYFDGPGKRCHSPYLSCSNKFSSAISQNGDPYFLLTMMARFNSMCRVSDFRTGQGIVGKALFYHKPCFCRDVTQLPKAEYPLSNNALSHGLTGCFAIWLHSTRINNHDYVVEFFLPPWNTISGDLQRYLELLLATVKKQLPDFKISSVGEESCVKVCEISVNDDEPDAVIISQTFSVKPIPESFANEREMVQDKVVGETVIGNGSNILGSEQDVIVVCQSEKTAGEELFPEAATNDEKTIRLPTMPESSRNENEVLQQLSDDEPTMEEAVRKNESNVAIVKQTSAAVAFSERIFSGAEPSKREYITADLTFSREDITKHFGKKLNDAARILGVSRSTMKRACRHHNIKKWPAPRRKKVNVLRVCSGNEGIEGTYKGDPSCSDPPPAPAKAGISHKTSNSRQEEDVGTVTVKATHGDDIIRFQLPFLSRKTDLVEKLTTRLLLNEGSFNIKYQDEENEWVLIACDEDLEECIGIWKGKSIIKMLVQPITNQAS